MHVHAMEIEEHGLRLGSGFNEAIVKFEALIFECGCFGKCLIIEEGLLSLFLWNRLYLLTVL